jgi:Tol biopolymer transport system component
MTSYSLLILVGVLSVSIFSLNTFVMLPLAVVTNQSQQHLLQSAFATFPGENGLIAFSARPDSQTVLGIYVMRSDGTGQIRINAEDGYGTLSSGPVWSPDGSKIAFSRQEASTVGNIQVMDYDGTNQIGLTNFPIDSYIYNTMGSWSPDGSKIVFTSNRVGGQSDIYIMNAADGGQVQRLTTNAREDQYPDWSPDGSKIVFESNRDGNFELYVINPDGSGETRLTNTNNEHEQLASWSPDGGKIAFQSGGNPDIYVMNSDGTGRMKLTDNAEQAVWSPEGDKIAFTKGFQEIYAMDAADGGNQVPLTGEQLSLENGPDWGTQTILPPSERDVSPPVINVPEDITVEATGPDGAQISFEQEPSATDDVDGPVDVTCDYNSGDIFPIGETVVTCSAEDAAGNAAEETFTVTVQDTTAPDVEITEAIDRRNREVADSGTTPTPYIRIAFEATDAVGIDRTECSLDGQAFTSCASPVVYDRLSRDTHEFTMRAIDDAGNVGEDEFTWTVGANLPATPPGRQ